MYIKETEVMVPLSYASRVRYNSMGYNFPKEYILDRTLVLVKVEHLSRKSNVKVTRICMSCGKEDKLTVQKS